MCGCVRACGRGVCFLLFLPPIRQPSYLVRDNSEHEENFFLRILLVKFGVPLGIVVDKNLQLALDALDGHIWKAQR